MTKSKMANRYAPEVRVRAVRMVGSAGLIAMVVGIWPYV